MIICMACRAQEQAGFAAQDELALLTVQLRRKCWLDELGSIYRYSMVTVHKRVCKFIH